jgi:hypothetical protein
MLKIVPSVNFHEHASPINTRYWSRPHTVTVPETLCDHVLGTQMNVGCILFENRAKSMEIHIK